MCLGVPGQIVEIEEDSIGMPMGKVSFGGVTKRVCFAYTPEARVGDYVVVHVGFAISQIDEAEAHQVYDYLKEMGELEELDVSQPSDLVGRADPVDPADPADPADPIGGRQDRGGGGS